MHTARIYGGEACNCSDSQNPTPTTLGSLLPSALAGGGCVMTSLTDRPSKKRAHIILHQICLTSGRIAPARSPPPGRLQGGSNEDVD